MMRMEDVAMVRMVNERRMQCGGDYSTARTSGQKEPVEKIEDL